MLCILDEPIMAKQSDPSTKTVRLPSELVDALADIAYSKKLKKEQFSVPLYLAAIVREQITADRKEALAFIRKSK